MLTEFLCVYPLDFLAVVGEVNFPHCARPVMYSGDIKPPVFGSDFSAAAKVVYRHARTETIFLKL